MYKMSDNNNREEIVGIIKILDFGLGAIAHNDLFFTSSRMIFANTCHHFLSSPLGIALFAGILNFGCIGLKIMGFGILGCHLIVNAIIIPIGLLFELSTRKERAEENSKRLNKLSPEDILHDHQRNFEMAYSTFIKVEISKSERNPTLKILTDKGWKKIGCIDKEVCSNYLDIIDAALPAEKVEVK